MNLQRYQEIRSAVLNEAKSVEDKKRLSYTSGDANVLRNFVSDAEFVGTNQLQNCLTHFMKQVRGISSYVQHPDVVPSETLLSRAADIINYVVLMVANAEDSGRETGLDQVFSDLDLGDPRENPPMKILFNGIEHTISTGPFDYNFGKDDV